MFRFFFIDPEFLEMGFGGWRNFAAVGLFFVALALLIFLVPEIIAYFIAAVLLFIGIFLLAAAWRSRRWQRRRVEFWW